MSYLGCSVRLLPLVVYWRAHVLFRMLGSSLPLVVYWRVHVLFRMFGSSFTSRCLLEGAGLI
jgi:hypothetical protein